MEKSVILNRLAPTVLTAALIAAGASVYVGAEKQGTPSVSPPAAPAFAAPGQAAAAPVPPQKALINRYCVGCHNQRTTSGNLRLDQLDVTDVANHSETWEKVARKVGAGMMPPSGMPRPDEAAERQFLTWLNGELDQAFDANPDPGRTETFHRLNRTEYRNAIRDLLALDIDVTDYLPADDSSYGFDNIAGVLRLSQALMERYLSAGKTIARIAVGAPPPAVGGSTYRNAPDFEQHDRVNGLPFGTRGGMRVTHLFPQDAEYDIKVEVAGARAPRTEHKLEVTIDAVQVKLFTIAPPGGRGVEAGYGYDVDGKLEVRVPVKAGPHEVGVTFYRKPPDLVEQVREPFPNPRSSGADAGSLGALPSVTSFSILGPHNARGAGDTPSRRRVFVCQPANPSQDAACARRIITQLVRRGFRGTGTAKDVDALMAFYTDGRKDGGSFDSGIEFAIRRLLVDPNFLFRVETDAPATTASASGAVAKTMQSASPTVYRISDLDLASRLSFFIWSSIPDDQLLDLASQNRLKDPAVLQAQVKRMLNDPRSSALTGNFAAQWLLVRNMKTVRPGDPFSLAFDETLRQSMERETELFFDSVIRENRPVTELLTASYTFLNERLAKHYGMEGIQGSHFRRVELSADSPRRGILGQGSVLTVTSHSIRTSPVLRGKWILNNILGTPPPDPPANVPPFPEQRTQAKMQTMRERMGAHRANPVCASCHNMIDPAGFALENFDAIGRWRMVDESFNPIDASGALPDGTKFNGVGELRTALVRRPERFVRTVTEKLLTYSLGRGLTSKDMTAVRRIVDGAAKDDYRFQTLVVEIAKSYPFVMRRIGEHQPPSAVAGQP
jgi:mono/diheme cytochrome c family protein